MLDMDRKSISFQPIEKADSHRSSTANDEMEDASIVDMRPYHRKTLSSRVYLPTALALALFLSLTALGVSIYTYKGAFSLQHQATPHLVTTHQVTPHSMSTSLGTCGKDIIEARRRGCVFDIMMGSWIKSECYPEGLSKRYLAKGNWTWYADKEGTQIVREEDMLKGDWKTLYTDGTFHYTHCAYLWEKQLIMTDKSIMILDTDGRSWHHNHHCLDFVSRPNTTYVLGKTAARVLIDIDRLDCVVAPWAPEIL